MIDSICGEGRSFLKIKKDCSAAENYEIAALRKITIRNKNVEHLLVN